MVSKGRASFSGIVAAAVALAVAELLAVWIGARSAPLIAVGGVVVDAVPEAVKQSAIALFGVHDKTALLIGTTLLLGAFAAAIGVLTRRWWPAGVVGIGVFTAIGVAAAVTRPGAGPLSAMPALAGGAAAVFVLYWLLRLAPVEPAQSGEGGPEADRRSSDRQYAEQRRTFLRTGAVLAGAAVLGGALGRYLSGRLGATRARTELALPTPADPAPALPAAVDPPAPGLAGYVTGVDDFYLIDTALVKPQIDPASWQLRIHGRVARPMTITFDQLAARPMIERYVTLACVSNEVGGDLIGNARWLGVPVKSLLEEAGPLPGADQVVSRSADGWTCGTPTELLLDGRDAMLAVGMNGEPLPIEHGFPVRMVVPGLYGYVSACKWIVEMELTSFAEFDAYWVRRGWSAKAPIKTQSRIDTPRNAAKVKPGEVIVAGVAWAQHRGITGVEVRVDGTWRPARLADTVSDDTWRQWTFSWHATPGRHELVVRAVDGTGQVQTGENSSVLPDGATGWHRITVDVG